MKIGAPHFCLFLLVAVFGELQAENTSNPRLDDALLNKLVGDWQVERKMASGRIEKNVVHSEWVLQHQFVELHYRDAASPPRYEAVVLITYDSIGHRYL